MYDPPNSVVGKWSNGEIRCGHHQVPVRYRRHSKMDRPSLGELEVRSVRIPNARAGGEATSRGAANRAWS